MMDLLEDLKTNKALLVGGAFIACLGIVFLFWSNRSTTEPVLEPFPEVKHSRSLQQEKKSEAENEAKSRVDNSGEVVVDVKGAVVSEGVYHLALGSRVTDAIKAAGGFTETADKKSVNLAQKLTDEGVVYVATVDEAVSVIAAQSSSGSPSSTGGKINLNKATVAELTTISGIGDKRAQDIIAYRESQGGFKSLEELTNISGIGHKTLERLKTEVSID